MFFYVKVYLVLRLKLCYHDTKEGKGAKKPLPDHISIVQPKEDTPIVNPYSEAKERKAEPLPQQIGHPQQLPPQQQQQPPIQPGIPGNFAY
jgi:hypothetical protein